MTSSFDPHARKIIPVILCGGSGTRLWPLSSGETPKQLLPMVNKTVLLYDTLMRAQECAQCDHADIITVTTHDLKLETIKQLESFNPNSTTHVIAEPESKNTAIAIAHAALYAQIHFEDNALLWILPADHYIENHDELRADLEFSKQQIVPDSILTFGITPTHADTGYGYIKTAKNHTDQHLRRIINFEEKPNQQTADQYFQSKSYLWNSGMFLASVETLLNHFIDYAPHILKPLHESLKNKTPIKQAYKNLPNIPFDKAIMEKTDKAYVIQSDIGWSDVGSWQSVWDLKNKDQSGNVLQGQIETHDTQDCLIHSDNLLIATIGLQDIAIIEHNGSVLIADKKNSDAVKKLAQSVQTQKQNLDLQTHPWGFEKIISVQKDSRVNEITIKPHQKVDLHFHKDRAEFWTVTSGEAIATLNGEITHLNAQDRLFILPNTPHSLENKTDKPVKIIEIQFGENIQSTDYHLHIEQRGDSNAA